MTNPKPDKETDTEIIYENSVVFTEGFKTEKKLIVNGNIDAVNIDAWDIDAWNIVAWDINAWDINARDINARDINARDIVAWDIICETRTKKSVKAKTKARIYIKNKSKIERKEHDD